MGIRVESIGISENNNGYSATTVDLIRDAAIRCFQRSRYPKEDIGILLNVSVYHHDHIEEPAYASIIQNSLELNHKKENSLGPRTFSFDVLNGSFGVLNGCHIANAMITSGKTKTVLLVSGDIVNEDEATPGICFTGVAMVLDSAEDESAGFTSFYFSTYSELQELYESYVYYEGTKLCFTFHKDPSLQQIYINTIARGLGEYLNSCATRLDEFDFIIPPQISPSFVSELSKAIGAGSDRMIDVSLSDGDLFNASFPKAFAYLVDNKLTSPGNKALAVFVGSGIQIGFAAYNF